MQKSPIVDGYTSNVQLIEHIYIFFSQDWRVAPASMCIMLKQYQMIHSSQWERYRQSHFWHMEAYSTLSSVALSSAPLPWYRYFEVSPDLLVRVLVELVANYWSWPGGGVQPHNPRTS